MIGRLWAGKHIPAVSDLPVSIRFYSGSVLEMKRNLSSLDFLRITIYLVLVLTLFLPSLGRVVEAASTISLRSASTGTNGAGSTHLVLTAPTGTQSGDVLIAQVVINSASSVITAPSGWALVLATKSGSSVEEATFYKAATASEPASYTWTFGASQPATGAITSYSGVNAVAPIDAKSGKYNSSTATATFAQITTTAPNDMLLAFVGVSGNTSVTPPAGFTEVYDLRNTASSSGKTAEMSQSLKASAGLTTVGTGKEDTLAVSNLTQLIALRAASGTPTPTLTPTLGPTPTPSPEPSPTAIATTPPFLANIQNVFVIVMENTNWSAIQGNISSAPYLNSLLLRPDASYATQYYNPAGLHPSEPNYIWMEAGDSKNLPGTNNFPSNGDPSATNMTTTTDHLVSYLQNNGIPWKGYMEGIAVGTCPVSSGNSYVARHDPFVFFTDVSGNPPSSSNTNCVSHIAPFTQLGTDLQNSAVPRYAFIVPNICNDMHDACAPVNDRILQGDRWLQNNIPTILNSQAYQQAGAVFITWDEGVSGDGPIGMIVLSPYAKGNGYHNSIQYDHSSLLRTQQEIFGLSPLLRNAAGATDLSDLFAASSLATLTATSTPILTSTLTSTETPISTSTVTSIPTLTLTSNPTETPTFTSTPTSLPTLTPTSTSTPTSPPTATSTPTGTSAPTSLTLTPVADSYVDTSNASANFGTSTQLRVDGSPIVNSYLRFTVPSLGGGSVSRVRLLIWANSASSSGIAAKTVANNTWGETTINASNAPAVGSTLATSPAVVTGTWITYDVTSYVTGQGTFSFGNSTSGATAISLASRESGAHSPQLIVDLH